MRVTIDSLTSQFNGADMGANAGAAVFLSELLEDNYYRERDQSALCLWLQTQDEGPLGGNPALGFVRSRLCNPPPPPPPPPEEFFDAGGVPCRDYIVSYETGTPGSPGTISVVNKKGPIGMVVTTTIQAGGAVNKRFTLTSGDGQGCPRLYDTMAGTSDARFVDVFARIISIVPVTPDPPTEVPIYLPPVSPPDSPPDPQEFEVTFNNEGFDVTASIELGPVINTNFGPVIQIGFNPTANFNPPINPDLGGDPKFGVDLNFEFVIELGGDPGFPAPAPGAEPIPLPGLEPFPVTDSVSVDYERIEEIVVANKCCKPITDVVSVGSVTFETPNQVAYFGVPSNAVAVFINTIPGNNTRVYKFAGADSEYGHGNASIVVNQSVLEFQRLYTDSQVLFFPEEVGQKGVRVSCVEGTVVSVSAGLYVQPE